MHITHKAAVYLLFFLLFLEVIVTSYRIYQFPLLHNYLIIKKGPLTVELAALEHLKSPYRFIVALR